MAEAATVIQLIQFSGLVLTCCYEYIDKAKRAPKEIQNAIDETNSIKNLLERLQGIASNPNDDRFVILKSLNRENGPFQACSSALAELDEKLKALTDASTVRRHLQWPLEAKGIEKILGRLEKLKSRFYTALAGDTAIQTDSIQDTVEEVRETVQDMKAAEEKNRILRWFDGPDPSINHNSAKSKREPGTCEWLVTSKDFTSWFNTPATSQLLWLHAFPGAGKTILSSAVIEHLRSQPLSADYAVIYYYFDFSNASRQTYLGFLRSLVRQICARMKTAPKPAVELYDACKGAAPSSEQLLELLKDLLKKQIRAFLIIDALDECPESECHERKQVLAALAEIKALKAPNLSIFVASRPEVDIKQAMDTICDIDIDVQAALTNEDIRFHIRAQMMTDPKLNRWQQRIKDEIEEKLMKDAGGSFRWAVCQLAEVRKCLKPARIRDELKNLPKDLDTTYSRILGNVPDMYHRELRTVLMLLSFSTRPMTIQEVAEATAVDLEEQSFTTDNRFGDPFDLLEVCSSLVSLTDVPGDTYSRLRSEGMYRYVPTPKDHKIIQFAHFSVKEYLLASRTQKSIPAPFLINDSLSQGQITQICLIYLLDFNGGKKVVRSHYSDFPFLGYSALHWATHLTQVKQTERDAIEALLMRVFDPKNDNHLLNFLNLHNPDRFIKELSMGPTSRTAKDFKPALYYASYYGLGPIVKFLLASLNDNEPRADVINSALTGAAGGGQPAVIDLLLDAGADPKSAICGDILYVAARAGNAAVVKKLVDAGAPIRAGGAYEGNALHVACEQGNSEVIQLFLDHGFDINSRCQQYGIPLSTALQADHADAVRVLLRNGADVNFPAEGYWNPLGMACYRASPELGKLLLEKGAKVNPSVNPLANAAKRGQMELMKLLLNHGADINCSSDSFYGTPLKGAIQSRQPEVLEFVLREGADINDRGGREIFPVDLAIFSGNVSAAERLIGLGAKFGDSALEEALGYSSKEYLAKILLDRGADPNAEHKKYGGILQFAIIRSSQECVEWLLEAGADPNGVPDGEYGTPLQAAVVSEKEELVRLLLKKGASVNPERICGHYGDPLCAAIRGDLEPIAHLLLDYGASLNRTGKGYSPPLQAAASKGFESIVRLLVSKGAKVHAVGGEYGTALRAALAHGHNEIAKYLLDNGADLMQRSEACHHTLHFTHSNETFTSALEVAVASNKTSTVQLLLDHGLDLNEPEDVCAAAIGRAVEVSGVEMLKFMIDKGANVKKHGGKAMSFDWGRWYEDLLEKTKLLIAAGANVRDYTGGKRHTALGTSILREDWEYVDFLLDAGADPNVVYSSGLNGSALNEAIERGNTEAVKKLLAKGADINLGAGHYGTPFVNAIISGDEELYRLFLDHGAIINPPEPYGSFGNPIQAAVSKEYYDIAHDLLDRGADIHLPGDYRSILTPACMGSGVGQVAMIERLLSLGADIEGEDKPRPVHDEVVKGLRVYLTPIQAAARSDREDLVALLLDKGARINPVPPQGTYGNPLQTAARKAHVNMVRFLLYRGADVNAVGGEYGTALQAAITEYSDALVDTLLDAGADPSIEGGCYGSALQAAAKLGWKRYVQLFLDRGVPINTNVGKYGNALAAAAKRAAKEVVEILLAHGANVNQAGGKYGTPLQAACCARGSSAEAHAEDIIQLLIDRGAEVNTKEVGKYGSALQAAVYHNRDYVRLLLKYGADPNAQGGKFGSPLKAASAKKSYRIEKELLDHGATPMKSEQGR